MKQEKHYKWDNTSGVVDEEGRQVIQLVGGTKKFRKICGTLLVERLNVKARGDSYAKQPLRPRSGVAERKQRMKKLILISLLVLMSCGPMRPEPPSEAVDNPLKPVVFYNSYGAYRFVDREAGVVCWVWNVTGGISCLPIDATKLK